MPTLENDITRFFEKLSLKIKIKKAPASAGQSYKNFVEIMPGTEVDPGRWENLLSCYFKNVSQVKFDIFRVNLKEFDPDGVEGLRDICKKCGCTHNDACHDETTGSCWWVHEDLCSACATPEQIKAAIEQMRIEYNAEKS